MSAATEDAAPPRTRGKEDQADLFTAPHKVHLLPGWFMRVRRTGADK